MVATAGKLETDFAVLAKLRTLGDGHNAGDPAFKQLQASLLAKYGVDSVDQLPVNFRGVVAMTSEQQLTAVLNDFASQRMQQELAQADIARQFGWLSPVVAIRSLSMRLAATDLESYHRFLREAEQVRYQFVQALNQSHAEDLSYQADTRRYQSNEAMQEARVSASTWQLLQTYRFVPDAAAVRLSSSQPMLLQLLVWLLGLVIVIRLVGSKVQ